MSMRLTRRGGRSGRGGGCDGGRGLAWMGGATRVHNFHYWPQLE